MPDMPSSYSSQSYHPAQYAASLFPAVIVLIVLLIEISRILASASLVIVGGLAIFLIPFLFEKKLRALFTRNVVVECNDDYLSITEGSSKTNAKRTEFVAKWDQIVAYKFYFSQSSKTFFTVYLRNGGRKTYCFQDKPTEEEAMSETSVFGFLRTYIQHYNARRPAPAQIVLRPAFFATQMGTALLWGVTLLAVADLVLRYRRDSHAPWGLLVMSIAILLGLWGNKFTSQALYKKLSQP